MPPFMRNPFKKLDENARPTSNFNGIEQKPQGSPSLKPIDIRAADKDPTEYKLSEINDSGVYLPPSPPERKAFWLTSSSRSTTSSSTNHRSVLNDNEPFNISRESFDSYRRSFDISARSPVIDASRPPRASLDSRTFMPPPPRSSNSYSRASSAVPSQTQEEESVGGGFEDVDIGVDAKPAPPQQKRRGLFSRFGDGGQTAAERPTSSSGGEPLAAVKASGGWTSHLPGSGRKRGQSGQGSELGSLPIKREGTPKPESMLRREHGGSGSSSQPSFQGPKHDASQVALAQAERVATPQPVAPSSIVVTEPPAEAGAEDDGVKGVEAGMTTLGLGDAQASRVAEGPAMTPGQTTPKAPVVVREAEEKAAAVPVNAQAAEAEAVPEKVLDS